MTVRPTNLDPAVDAQRRAWLAAASVVAAALVAIAPFFQREIVHAIGVWIDSPTYNHCFLILPIVLYLIWTRRDALADVTPRPAPWGLAALIPLGLLWFVAARLDVLEARQLLFIAMVQAIIFSIIGGTAYRRLLGPLLYLFFLVPSGEFLVPKLQDVTAYFTILGLKAVGVPVFSDGTYIEIPEGTFVVAEACAGLRFLVASIAYGVLFGLLVYVSWWRRAAFVALSIVIPVIANGIRAFGIVFAAHTIGNAQAVEADHILYGWIFFSIVIFLLTLLGMSFAERDPWRPAPAADFGHRLVSAGVSGWPWRVAVLAVVLAAAAPAFAMMTGGGSHSLVATAVNFPQPSAPWERLIAPPEWNPAAIGTERELTASYSDGHNVVEVYVALYASHGDNNIMRSLGRSNSDGTWEPANVHATTAQAGERRYEIQAGEVRSRNRSRNTWSFYIIDGRVVSGTLAAKLLEAYAGAVGRGHNAAFIVISTPSHNGDALAAETLGRFFASLPALDGYIAAFR